MQTTLWPYVALLAGFSAGVVLVHQTATAPEPRVIVSERECPPVLPAVVVTKYREPGSEPAAAAPAPVRPPNVSDIYAGLDEAWPKNPAVLMNGARVASLAEAVEHAPADAVILLPQGLYEASLHLRDKRLTLRAPFGPARLIAPTCQPGITVERGAVTLDGLWFSSNDDHSCVQGGVSVKNAESFTLRRAYLDLIPGVFIERTGDVTLHQVVTHPLRDIPVDVTELITSLQVSDSRLIGPLRVTPGQRGPAPQVSITRSVVLDGSSTNATFVGRSVVGRRDETLLDERDVATWNALLASGGAVPRASIAHAGALLAVDTGADWSWVPTLESPPAALDAGLGSKHVSAGTTIPVCGAAGRLVFWSAPDGAPVDETVACHLEDMNFMGKRAHVVRVKDGWVELGPVPEAQYASVSQTVFARVAELSSPDVLRVGGREVLLPLFETQVVSYDGTTLIIEGHFGECDSACCGGAEDCAAHSRPHRLSLTVPGLDPKQVDTEHVVHQFEPSCCT